MTNGFDLDHDLDMNFQGQMWSWTFGDQGQVLGSTR